MGLAAPKNRTKIGSDPNNTKWSRSTTRFGHKILTSQGWKPGDTLGVEGASHAEHYTAASSSHIRVLLRDDNLGIGAKNGRQENDVVGLYMFQDLLGRLNGKSEGDLAKEAGVRRDLKLKELSMRRFGATTFVSGGFLVGDKIDRGIKREDVEKGLVKQEDVKQEDVKQEDVQQGEKDIVAVRTKSRKSKKRKQGEDDSEDTPEESLDDNKNKAAKVKGDTSNKNKKRSKKDRTEKKQHHQNSTTEDEEEDSTITTREPTEKEAKKVRKAERKAAREARRLEKEDRKRKKRKEKEQADTVASDSSEAEVQAPALVQAVGAVPRGRFHVRARYMQQKRLASSDPQALKEIFMIKAKA